VNRVIGFLIVIGFLSLGSMKIGAQQQQQGQAQSPEQTQKQPEKPPPSGQPPAQVPPDKQQPTDKPDAGPTKAELDAAEAAASTNKPPPPPLSFKRGFGVDIYADFLQGGYSDELEIGLGGIRFSLCRAGTFSFCSIGAMFSVRAGGGTGGGSDKGGERFVFTFLSLTRGSTKYVNWTISPFWDPFGKGKKFGVLGGWSFTAFRSGAEPEKEITVIQP
jgi:hypothetical protein